MSGLQMLQVRKVPQYDGHEGIKFIIRAPSQSSTAIPGRVILPLYNEV